MSILRLAPIYHLQSLSTRRWILQAQCHPSRKFSLTPQRQSDIPKPEELLASLRHTKLFKELERNTELREALMDAVKVLQEEGFDPNKKTSMMMFITNSKIREKMVRVTTAVQAAGIDPADAKEAMELVKTRMKPDGK